MKIAVIHYWLVSIRGGENVLECIFKAFPDADLFCHVIDRDKVGDVIGSRNIKTSFISNLPFSKRFYKKYLPLMPIALEQFDMRDYDLVISSESGPAKGVITKPGTVHICYCHTPMRYIWDMYKFYYEEADFLSKLAMPLLTQYLRTWDVVSSNSVDHFVANSRNVAKRICKYYRRHADVIYPPVRTHEFAVDSVTEDFYLYVGEMVPYKRIDLAIRACNELGRRLVIVGDGQQLNKLKKISSPNIEFLGRVDLPELKKLYARSRALLFPGEEDFGIVPLEAMSSGRPVIAYGRGGARETVVDGVTGLLFGEQSVEALTQAMLQFEQHSHIFEKSTIVRHASKFNEERFIGEFRDYVLEKMNPDENCSAPPDVSAEDFRFRGEPETSTGHA